MQYGFGGLTHGGVYFQNFTGCFCGNCGAGWVG